MKLAIILVALSSLMFAFGAELANDQQILNEFLEQDISLKHDVLETFKAALEAKRAELERAVHTDDMIKKDRRMFEQALEKDIKLEKKSIGKLTNELDSIEDEIFQAKFDHEEEFKSENTRFSSSKKKLLENLREQEYSHDKADAALLDELKSDQNVDSLDTLISSIENNDKETKDTEQVLENELRRLESLHERTQTEIDLKYDKKVRKLLSRRGKLSSKLRESLAKETEKKNDLNEVGDQLKLAEELNQKLLKQRIKFLDVERQDDLDELVAAEKEEEKRKTQKYSRLLLDDQSSQTEEINFSLLRLYYRRLLSHEEELRVDDHERVSRFLNAVETLVNALRFMIKRNDAALDRQVGTIQRAEENLKELLGRQRAVSRKLRVLEMSCPSGQEGGEKVGSSQLLIESILEQLTRKFESDEKQNQLITVV